jgi:hypothetical protein
MRGGLNLNKAHAGWLGDAPATAEAKADEGRQSRLRPIAAAQKEAGGEAVCKCDNLQ